MIQIRTLEVLLPEVLMCDSSGDICDYSVFCAPCGGPQNIIDGDLCESFALLPADAQKRIAEDFEKTPADLLKQLDDIRNRIL